MHESKARLSFIGIGVGAIALLLAIVHFWAGPFNSSPLAEKTLTEKGIAIKDKAKAVLKGEEISVSKKMKNYDVDKILTFLTAVLGGIAIILGVIGFAMKEPLRVVSSAALLGSAAIAFQYIILAFAALIVILVAFAFILNFDGFLN